MSTLRVNRMTDVGGTGPTYAPGHVIQVVGITKTDTFSASVASGSYVDITGLSVSITPKSSSSKILILCNLNGTSDSAFTAAYAITRDGTRIGLGNAAGSRTRVSSQQYAGAGRLSAQTSFHIYDSPATTSSITYQLQFAGGVNTGTTVTHHLNRVSDDVDFNYIARSASSITIMEIAQ